MIYSPEVPMFRTDDGALLEEPWTMSVLTCPAVHGVFDEVVFAVTDWSDERPFIGPFERVFGG